MFASKSTIGRQGVWRGAYADKNEGKIIKHGNRGNSRGRKFYVQVVTKKGAAKDANETMSKTIVHFTSGDTFVIRKPKKKKPGYMKNHKNRRVA